MKLRGIDFGPCTDAAGLRGFFGEGYWFHNLPLLRRWYDFVGSTFVAKTATLLQTAGNMPLEGNELYFQPRKQFPSCIWVSWRHGIALNAVGLSNPGIDRLLQKGLLNPKYPPYMISFMAVKKTPDERAAECRAFVTLLGEAMKRLGLKPQTGLQINISCPNAGLDPTHMVHEAMRLLSIAAALDIPLMIKVSALVPVSAIKEISKHEACDAICCSNTIPFGAQPEGFVHGVPWKRYFTDNVSPLAKRGFGAGGLSGAPLLRIVAEWIYRLRDAGIDIPINAGGGILHPDDVDTLVRAGLQRGRDSVFVGSIAMLRPWRINKVIRRAHELLG